MSEKNKTVEGRVIKVLKEQFGDERKINLDTSLIEDLNADSLDAVEIIVDLESEFDIKIPDEDAESFNYVKQIVNYITKKTSTETKEQNYQR